MKREIEPSVLKELLRYEPATGKLFWRKRDVSFFKEGKYSAEHVCAVWNAKYTEKEALTAKNAKGYFHGSIFDKRYLAHRVIWAMVHGEWPEQTLDHISGVRTDNRISNLRDVPHQENMKNQKLRSASTSGCLGVWWYKRDGKWQASIKVDGRNKLRGRFTEKSDAIAARQAAEIKYGYHENHGRLA